MNAETDLAIWGMAALAVFVAAVVWGAPQSMGGAAAGRARGGRRIHDEAADPGDSGEEPAPEIDEVPMIGGDPMGLDEVGYDRPEWRMADRLAVAREEPNVLGEARHLRAIDRMRLGDPLVPPYRRYDQMVLGPVPTAWNVPTQGEPGLFQVVGYLYQDDQPERMLRLFGRRVDRNNYEYYTTSPNDTLLKIPIVRPRGDEIVTDDLVNVTGFKEPFKAVLYDVEELRYVPYIR